MEDSPMPRGGKWPGAGRPPGTTIPEHLRRRKLNMFRLPQWMIKRLQKEYGRKAAKTIEKAVLEFTGWDPPEK